MVVLHQGYESGLIQYGSGASILAQSGSNADLDPQQNFDDKFFAKL
jgi:hypothetical protein